MGRLEKVIEKYGEVSIIDTIIETFPNTGLVKSIKRKRIIKRGVPIKTIKDLSKWDPSGNNKYLDWIIDRKLNHSINYKELKIFVTLFNKSPNKFKYTDIYSYSTKDEILEELSVVPTKLSKSEMKLMGAELVEETDDYKIVIPTNHMVSKMYGSNTKWCTTTDDPFYFNDYNRRYCIYYCIIKNPEKVFKPKFINETTLTTYNKIALLYARNKIKNARIEMYDAKDERRTVPMLRTVYNIDFCEICDKHYEKNRNKIHLINMADILKTGLMEVDLGDTKSDTITMINKIIQNIEESK